MKSQPKVGAGVVGPYGVHLGWDDDMLYIVGKGELSHGRGKTVGIVSGQKTWMQNTRPGSGKPSI